MPGLTIPEMIDGRRIWLDGPMQDVIDKLQRGDPTKGWEGDPRMYVRKGCLDERGKLLPPNQQWFEIWREEDDGVHRMTCRSAPGVPFHEGIIDVLVSRDRRRFKKSLHDQIVEQNEKVDADIRRRNDDYINEEVNPRMNWALRKDGLL